MATNKTWYAHNADTDQKPIRKDWLEKQGLDPSFLFKICNCGYHIVTWALDINFQWNKTLDGCMYLIPLSYSHRANTLGVRQAWVQIIHQSFNSWGQFFMPLLRWVGNSNTVTLAKRISATRTRVSLCVWGLPLLPLLCHENKPRWPTGGEPSCPSHQSPQLKLTTDIWLSQWISANHRPTSKLIN